MEIGSIIDSHAISFQNCLNFKVSLINMAHKCYAGKVKYVSKEKAGPRGSHDEVTLLAFPLGSEYMLEFHLAPSGFQSLLNRREHPGW